MARLHDVRLLGLDRLLHKLRPEPLLETSYRMMERVGRTVHKTAQRAAKPHEADKGTLGRAILMEIEEGRRVVRVFPHRSIAGIALTIEEGRRPGRRPPYTPIKRWLLSHGYIGTERDSSKRVREVQEEIKLRGTRGVGFMRQAVETGQKALREGIPQTEREIEALWRRP